MVACITGYPWLDRNSDRGVIALHKLYVPYTGRRPASVMINGHRLVILSHEPGPLEDSLDVIGADRIKEFVPTNDREAEEQLNKIAKSGKAGIVIAPPELEMEEVIRNLESELPWLQ